MTAAIGVQAQAVELPATELGVLGQQLPCGVPGGAPRQSEDEVGVLGHYVHYDGTCHPLRRGDRKGNRNEFTVFRR